ncbi:Cam kinase kinase protein 1, isoform a, putative [Brugia malayi]|uniref:calcium/calmodulin-dependent protein kinase n=1 Tax=Brugia malayi TaxID=6279 RepID=A0A4E9F5W7_BRUMA|nr:Cam kinase kinase protein 1, isoform a, putative [Brugia malayi]VIO92139.1 Cam kinase kinase protein 1, isoform a, putative [Brugia malayi]
MDINYCDTWLRRRKSSFCSGTQTLSPPNVNYSLKRWLQQGIDEKYKQLNQYRFIQEIGQGSYGIVKLAYNEEDKNLYALKVLDKMKLLKNFACFRPPPTRRINNYSSVRFPRDPIKAVQREIAILKKLSHPNIVKLVEVLSDPNDRYLYMVFELLENGPVLEIPTDKPLDEKTAWLYFRDTVKGLEYLHYQKIVHRDIKPSNLLLSETGHVKIADFGISYEFQGIDAFLCGTAGTPAFMAPEALTEDSSCFYSGRAQDIWSLGVTLYAFVYGVVPFWDSYVIALHKKIKNDAVNFPKTSVISKSLKLLILNLLKKDPGLRLMLNEIKEHNWVTQNGRYPMPSETTNCELITVTNEEIQNCVRNIPHLDTLILIKFMVHRRRFGNPFKIMRKTSECNSLLTTNRHNEKIIKSDISKSMDVLNAKTKNLLLNAGTIKANRSESVDKKVNRSSGSWL